MTNPIPVFRAGYLFSFTFFPAFVRPSLIKNMKTIVTRLFYGQNWVNITIDLSDKIT